MLCLVAWSVICTHKQTSISTHRRTDTCISYSQHILHGHRLTVLFTALVAGIWNSLPAGAHWLSRALDRRNITWASVEATLGTEKQMQNQWEQGSGEDFVFKLHPQTVITNTRCLMSARLPSQLQASAAKENMPLVDNVWMGDVQYPRNTVSDCPLAFGCLCQQQ